MCQTEGTTTATYYVQHAVVSRKRQEAIDFINQHIEQHGAIAKEEDLIQLCANAIQYGKQVYLKQRAEEPGRLFEEQRFAYIEL